MRLSVIIVNYNVGYFLEQCLHTVIQATSGLSAEILVVDNASTDNSRELFAGRFPEVQFLWNTTNTGFARANNQALEISRGEYIVFLNPDTLVPQNVFTTCLDFFAAHPDAGGVGMRMFDGQGNYLPESKRGWPGIMTSFFKLSGLTHIFPKQETISRYYLGHLSPGEVHPVEVLAGAFMVMPRKVYEKVGGFDEQFFMYGEDIDLSYRISLAGYTNYYLPDPGIIHFKGESSGPGASVTNHFYEAMEIFVRKYYPQKSNQWRFLLQVAIKGRAMVARLNKKGTPLHNSVNSISWLVKGDKLSTCEIAARNPGISLSEEQGAGCIYALGQDFGLKEVLESWKAEGPPKMMRFHATDSSGIVGSDDKNGLGEVIILKKEDQH